MSEEEDSFMMFGINLRNFHRKYLVNLISFRSPYPNTETEYAPGEKTKGQ